MDHLSVDNLAYFICLGFVMALKIRQSLLNNFISNVAFGREALSLSLFVSMFSLYNYFFLSPYISISLSK